LGFWVVLTNNPEFEILITSDSTADSCITITFTDSDTLAGRVHISINSQPHASHASISPPARKILIQLHNLPAISGSMSEAGSLPSEFSDSGHHSAVIGSPGNAQASLAPGLEDGHVSTEDGGSRGWSGVTTYSGAASEEIGYCAI
jgi:hypothetical protein